MIHVEAGPRTGGHNFSPFPEELNRQLITRIASFHLAPTAIDALGWAALLDVPVGDPAINEMLERDEPFVVLIHPNPAVRAELAPPLEGLPNVLLTPPLPFAEFARRSATAGSQLRS